MEGGGTTSSQISGNCLFYGEPCVPVRAVLGFQFTWGVRSSLAEGSDANMGTGALLLRMVVRKGVLEMLE
ncbi:hypothetical protein QYF36_002973 [Acer negundo]|nr:hypothetical protein QYF36_002973 [Acer negundo]